jgi:SAM-dependent methyltransferase
MKHWGDGYVTDIQYVDEFNPEQSPQNIALAATLRGFEPPDLSGQFAYCELGCGKGLTSLIFAAANPNAEFHAIDFNPSYIARAEAQARAAQLTNITFHERSIEDLTGADAPTLPMFDIVALHGVWSWVSGISQAAREAGRSCLRHLQFDDAMDDVGAAAGRLERAYGILIRRP